MQSSVMQAEDLFFNEKDVRDVYNKVINTLCNVAEFYSMYKSEETLRHGSGQNVTNILDKWILSKLNRFISEEEKAMNSYNTVKSCRLIKEFVEDLSLWYIRRSRKRFEQAEPTLRSVLFEFSKAIAPILPFTSEFVFEKVKQDSVFKSVHLCDWPGVNKKLINNDLENKMDQVRKIVGLAMSERVAKGIKVKQPLALLKVKDDKIKLSEELLGLIKDEVNVKEIIFDDKISSEVELDTDLTEELKEEGFLRELVREVQTERKEQNLVPQDKVIAELSLPEFEIKLVEKNREFLLKEFRANEIIVENSDKRLIKIKRV